MIPQRAHNFGTYFITTQTWERRSVFQVEQYAQLFVQTLYHYRHQQKYLLHDFVVMPNHIHLLITPSEITIECAVQFIKGGFSHDLRQTGRNMEVWQKGFTDHRIRDAEDYEHHRKYLLMNPVRRGLCNAAEEYLYSSVRLSYEVDPVPQRLKPLASGMTVRHG